MISLRSFVAVSTSVLLMACQPTSSQQSSSTTRSAPVVAAPAQQRVAGPIVQPSSTTDLYNDVGYWARLYRPSWQRLLVEACPYGDNGPNQPANKVALPSPPFRTSNSLAEAQRKKAAIEAYMVTLAEFYACAEENMVPVSEKFAEGAANYVALRPYIEQKRAAGGYEGARPEDFAALETQMSRGADVPALVERAVANYYNKIVPDLQAQLEFAVGSANEGLRQQAAKGRVPSFSQIMSQTLARTSASLRDDTNRALIASGRLPILSPQQLARIRQTAQTIAARNAANPSPIPERYVAPEGSTSARPAAQNDPVSASIENAETVLSPVSETARSSNADAASTSISDSLQGGAPASTSISDRLQGAGRGSTTSQQTDDLDFSGHYAGQTAAAEARKHNTTLESAQSLVLTAVKNRAYEVCREKGLEVDQTTWHYTLPVCEAGTEYTVPGHWCEMRVTFICMP